ncbi:MAG: PAS domain S-box protein [Deferribacteres bacterium]|nr:PAS domain S-box protein [Deferribacteres bacterium]
MRDEDKTKDQLISELQETRRRLRETESLYRKHKQAAETLRFFEKALETMQLGVTITDRDRKIIYVNPADASMHGYSVDELRGKNVRMFAPAEIWKPLTEEQILSMKRWKRESINKRKDGTSFPVQLMSDVVTDTEGKPIGIVTTCEDITERKDMEKELKERVEELEKFYEMAVGRELRMKELKEEIKKMKSELQYYINNRR